MSKGSEGLSRKALDGGVLIALAIDDPAARKLKDEILRERVLAFCSEIALVEMEYVLCRKLRSKIAEEKRRYLLESNMINIIETNVLMNEVAKLKCERALSLPDCFTLSLAKIFNCEALFVKREKEIEEEVKRKSFNIEIEFLM
ncbi:MAG: PIN domain-containing protein [Candidatus Bathyarchaeia archaeon]